MKKHIERFLGLLMAVGFFIAIGTAGSADLNLIDLKTMVVRVVLGMLLMVVGLVGLKLIGSKCVY